MFLITLVLFLQVLYTGCDYVTIPYLKMTKSKFSEDEPSRRSDNTTEPKFIDLQSLVGDVRNASHFWRETELLSLLRSAERSTDMTSCQASDIELEPPLFRSNRLVMPVCSVQSDPAICPSCVNFSNATECELFQDSCKERRVMPWEYDTYCDSKYGRWRTLFVPASAAQCRCCDECIFYRELDQSCVQDEYHFDNVETLPVTTVDFRAGCNPYQGHPEYEQKSLRCDRNLRRCVPLAQHLLQKDPPVKDFRFKPIGDPQCRVDCRRYRCSVPLVTERQCRPGAFLPERTECNCCGWCSHYLQVDQQCLPEHGNHRINKTEDMGVKEEQTLPDCDDGLICRQGVCQDIHKYSPGEQTKRAEHWRQPYEPCKDEMRVFKKKYGVDGHLHYSAPQCTPLWLYAPIQCRYFVCHCALEDGSIIAGTKTPRIDVINMNCDCAREKCRTGGKIECDNYGSYKRARFSSGEDHLSPHYLSKAAAYYASFTNDATGATTRRSTEEEPIYPVDIESADSEIEKTSSKPKEDDPIVVLMQSLFENKTN